jgi:hypothetical protein
VLPHDPQLLGSELTFVQVPLQTTPLGTWLVQLCPAVWQTPALQAPPFGQVTLQPPQLLVSTKVLTQPWLHEVVPPGHVKVQAPETQVSPAGQA